MIKTVLKNIWEWGVKPMAVGSAVVGALGVVVAAVIFGVMKLANVYEYQLGWTHETAHANAVFTPFAIFIVWLIGWGVLSAMEERKRWMRQQARWAEEQAAYEARHRGDKRHAG